MFSNTRTIIFVAIVIIVVGGIGYYNIKKDRIAADGADVPGAVVIGGKESDADAIHSKTGDSTAIKTDTEDEKVPIAGSVSATAAISVPGLDRSILFGGGYSAEQKGKIEGQVKTLTDALKADPNLFNDWMDLALLLKSVGDYEWAREAWEYASAIRPGNSLSFANLGVLYGYYLKDPVKAEANLLHAIENEPRFLDFYARTADFYLEVMKDKSKAADFLDRAIAKYPEWVEIKELRMHITE